jgi:hypothetical protein
MTAIGLLSAARLSVAAGVGGHVGSVPAGAIGGSMHTASTISSGRLSTDWTAPVARTAQPRDVQGRTDRLLGSRADTATLLEQNSGLNARLQKLLPAEWTPQRACDGFGNLGGCVAALHVASNLEIPFADLKARVTGADSTTLGGAIRELKPDADAGHAQREAETQARHDLRAAGL